MSRKRFTAEQIIALLREADVKMSQNRLTQKLILIYDDFRPNFSSPHHILLHWSYLPE